MNRPTENVFHIKIIPTNASQEKQHKLYINED